ncbi:MAG TPA: DEAD/DEAH box helicase [Candidatus Hydrogenedentes bacterium]|jgi:DEAD/DEAH box helicase domain-containing protein|nr:DEAD/DEAH box helicase [Candidatus Hydrogenedentota bacterium]MDY0032542.1 DEAD/DEAH box helicase [FCB group bacterium]HNZ19258.1 DEAD/DEAH box helicase [Candidatus Hydrogenedentota bacterium]HOH33775.1 DEAD/DEAH box helicase [Candidatus Hydrogenedentota bacterium]HPV37490.1 DEAD/DEAH box helicase [Candidatus Hydrogenedentota bacterium]
MNVAQTIDRLRSDPDFTQSLTAWRTVPAQPARCAGFPGALDAKLVQGLQRRGVQSLYTHQREALEAILAGENVCVVTPTASGKTLCYNVPVLNTLMQDPEARALYLFPTKALSQDQVHELQDTIEDLEVKIGAYTFDGDTPGSARKAVRQAGHIVVTNPDMLHTGILPHHTKWLRLFENLRYVVIDELHHYRGVFGSHLANVLRRLKRICAFYGSNPQFICCSATIRNPQEMAERLVERPVRLIDNNGAPQGERHFLFYNPPVVNAELGIRRSSVKEAVRLARHFLTRDVQSIIFARSRLRVEIIATYLKEAVRKMGKSENLVRGYRGGYLPNERRDIERGLRDGGIMSVVSTNALELGIDIGSLDACIMTGYSGSVASTWQQAGRAGRRSSVSLVVLIASSAPLDQYIINHPDYFFGQPPENATVDPNNLIIVASHMKCAAFEIPFTKGEAFGLDPVSTGEMLDFLSEQHVLRRVKDKWHWSADAYPAEDISLRTAAPGNVVILDTSDNGRVIGEVDLFAAPVELHENAIYIHQSAQYTVDVLDLEDRKAYVRPVEADYYTDAQIKVDLKTINTFRQETIGEVAKYCGEVSVTWLPSIYKKIKFGTHENVGWGEIKLPESTMHTSSYWLEFTEDVDKRLGLEQKELSQALGGLANTLRQVAPVQVMCDVNDIRAEAMLRAPFTQCPTIFLYEVYPGGVGFSDKLFTHHKQLLEAAASLIAGCGCTEGCPSCVGPALEVGEHGKNGALKLARIALGLPVEPPEAGKPAG